MAIHYLSAGIPTAYERWLSAPALSNAKKQPCVEAETFLHDYNGFKRFINQRTNCALSVDILQLYFYNGKFVFALKLCCQNFSITHFLAANWKKLSFDLCFIQVVFYHIGEELSLTFKSNFICKNSWTNSSEVKWLTIYPVQHENCYFTVITISNRLNKIATECLQDITAY